MQYSGWRVMGWRIVVVLMGMLGVLAAYYWVHKPPVPAVNLIPHGIVFSTLLAHWRDAALDGLTVAAIALTGGGVGRQVLSRFDLRTLSHSERLALEGAFGLGFLAWAVLLLGLVGLYTRIALWGLVIVATLLTASTLREWVYEFRQLIRRGLHPRSLWERFLMLLVAFLLLTGLLMALAPVHAWDALTYHLVGPGRYLAASRIDTQTDNHFLGFPQGVEVMYGVAISLFGHSTAAAPLHWWFGLLALMAVAGITKRYSNASTAWLALVLLLGAFSVWLWFGWPYVDLAVMVYGALTLILLTQWREAGSAHWLLLLGINIGLAMGVKYPSGGLLLASGVYMLWRAPRQIVRNSLIVGGLAMLAMLPWLIKGVLLYDNPIYPFVFNGVNWDAGRAATFSTTGQGLLDNGFAWHLPVLPLAATVFGIEKLSMYNFTSSPWLLTAPLLLLVGWRWLDDRKRQLMTDIALLGLPLLSLWAFSAATTGIGLQPRMMAMGLPLAAIAGAIAFQHLRRWPRKPLDIGFIVHAMLVLTLLAGLLDVADEMTKRRVVPYFLGAVTSDAYLDRSLGTHIHAMRELDDLPSGSRVRLLWEPRSFYCPADITCMPDILFDYWGRGLQSGHTPASLFAQWRNDGDDFVLVFNDGQRFSENDEHFPENAIFRAAIADNLQLVWTDAVESYTLWRWPDN